MGIDRGHNISIVEVFNFDEILRPYRSAGTKSNPVQMKLETLAGALIITDKVPADIAGAVIFQTCYDIVHGGLDFKGDGKYGSKWREMINHIRGECLQLMQRGAAKELAQNIMDTHACTIRRCPSRTKKIAEQTRWQGVKRWARIPRLSISGCVFVYGVLTLIYAFDKEVLEAMVRLLNSLI